MFSAPDPPLTTRFLWGNIDSQITRQRLALRGMRLFIRTGTIKSREAGRRSAALYGCGDGLIAYRDFEPRYPDTCARLPSNSHPRPAAMTCCGPHVPPIRSGTELAYVIANPQGAHRELRPSPVIAHLRRVGPPGHGQRFLTDGWTRSTPHNRQHTSMLPGFDVRPVEYRTGARTVDKSGGWLKTGIRASRLDVRLYHYRRNRVFASLCCLTQ